MGPRPLGRGRGPPAVVVVGGVVASMGPRPLGRGRVKRSKSASAAHEASMGPRPLGRGRRRHRQADREAVGRQWGRDLSAAEGTCAMKGRPRSRHSVNGAATSRPRKDRNQASLIIDVHNASMGPRPLGRGRAKAIDDCGPFPRRQWGRDLSAAEGPRSTTSRDRGSCVNGAATSRPRKVARRTRPTARSAASMGPRPLGRGRAACWAASRPWGR